MNQACLITVELGKSEFWLLCFLSTVPGDYILVDQIVVVADILSGSAAIDWGNLPMTEKAEAIKQHFQTNSVLTVLS